MRRSPIIWLVTLVAFLFSGLSFSSGDIERVREVFADGSSREFCRVDLDGIVADQKVAPPRLVSPGTGRGMSRTIRLVQVFESLACSAPAQTLRRAGLTTPDPGAALVPPALPCVACPPADAGCFRVEIRGSPHRPVPLASPSLRAPPLA